MIRISEIISSDCANRTAWIHPLGIIIGGVTVSGRVVQIPTALFGTASHRLVEAAELLAAAVDRF